MKYKFLEKDGQSIRFTGDVMKIYVPDKYFNDDATSSVAEYNGNEINTIAFFYFEVKTFEYEEKNKDGHFYIMKLPTKISFQFDEQSTEVKNIKNSGDIKYRVFTINKGSLFVTNINIQENANNAKEFLYMMHGGKFPSIIPYDEIMDIYLKNLEINKMNLKTLPVIFEIMIGELMRSKDDPLVPFRKAANEAGVSMYDYQNTNMKNIPFFNSTYTSLAFEDINKAITSSLSKERNGTKEIVSPAEKTIKY